MTNKASVISTSSGRLGTLSKCLSSDVRGGVDLMQFTSLTIQLGAVLLVIWQFQLEASYGLLQLLPLVYLGFLVHALIPLEWRLPGFFFLSLTAILTVLGFLHGAIVIGAGVGLIAICHLPIGFRWRVLIILGVMVLCATLRAGWISTPLPTLGSVVVPVLAAMFMFRLAIYMYDLRYEKNPGSMWESLSYFFLLPNVCFLLFPVVDYKTFRRTYYDKPAYGIYQKGLLWMMRGVLHLLVYRAVYYFFTIAPSEVTGLGSAVHYMISTYMLYLHISGQFHLIIGMLCLFGFNLPETHHLFYLASGFSDYWRRINIYWKDFMMQMVFYPVLMRVRVLGITTGIVIATLVVFLGTWILHAYQWFWLRGDFLLTATDASFWGILALLVVINSVIETKFRRKKKRLGSTAWDLTGAVVHSLKVVGMLVTITVLWTLWNSHTMAGFVGILSAAASDDLSNWVIFIAALVGLIGVGVLLQFLRYKGFVLTETGNAPSPKRAAMFTGITALALIVVAGGFPFYVEFDERTEAFVLSLSAERLNGADRDKMEAGYYEGLLDMGGYTSALARVHGRKPNDWIVLEESKVVQQRDDVIDFELAPSTVDNLKMVAFETNRWGMRDQDYELEKAPGVLRIALLGASYNMAAGVEQEDVFETIAERKLNEAAPGIAGIDHYEILNFGVAGYSLIQQAAIIEPKVKQFSPDVAVLTVHANEPLRLRVHLQSLFNKGKPVQYPIVERALASSGAELDMRHATMAAKLLPLTGDLEAWAISEIGLQLRAAGIRPIALYIPYTLENEGIDVARRDLLKALCEEAGFEFLELDNAFLTDDILSLQLSTWDTHPNTEANGMIGQLLYELILREDRVFTLDQP
jgi:hypothetical protein